MNAVAVDHYNLQLIKPNWIFKNDALLQALEKIQTSRLSRSLSTFCRSMGWMSLWHYGSSKPISVTKNKQTQKIEAGLYTKLNSHRS